MGDLIAVQHDIIVLLLFATRYYHLIIVHTAESAGLARCAMQLPVIYHFEVVTSASILTDHSNTVISGRLVPNTYSWPRRINSSEPGDANQTPSQCGPS